MELRRGDLIEVQWVDIFEDPVGDPDAGELAVRLSIGYFWGTKMSAGQWAFVTTTTLDTKDEGTNGFCIYPLGVVKDVRIIRRGKGKDYRGRVPFVFTKLETLGSESGDLAGSRRPKKQRGAPALRGSDLPEQSDVPEVPESGSGKGA